MSSAPTTSSPRTSTSRNSQFEPIGADGRVRRLHGQRRRRNVVFGVADNRVGRDFAILGVPLEVSVNRLKLAVHDGTDPTLTPVFGN